MACHARGGSVEQIAAVAAEASAAHGGSPVDIVEATSDAAAFAAEVIAASGGIVAAVASNDSAAVESPYGSLVAVQDPAALRHAQPHTPPLTSPRSSSASPTAQPLLSSEPCLTSPRRRATAIEVALTTVADAAETCGHARAEVSWPHVGRSSSPAKAMVGCYPASPVLSPSASSLGASLSSSLPPLTQNNDVEASSITTSIGFAKQISILDSASMAFATSSTPWPRTRSQSVRCGPHEAWVDGGFSSFGAKGCVVDSPQRRQAHGDTGGEIGDRNGTACEALCSWSASPIAAATSSPKDCGRRLAYASSDEGGCDGAALIHAVGRKVCFENDNGKGTTDRGEPLRPPRLGGPRLDQSVVNDRVGGISSWQRALRDGVGSICAQPIVGDRATTSEQLSLLSRPISGAIQDASAAPSLPHPSICDRGDYGRGKGGFDADAVRVDDTIRPSVAMATALSDVVADVRETLDRIRHSRPAASIVAPAASTPLAGNDVRGDACVGTQTRDAATDSTKLVEPMASIW
eukprot:TRINITY_DN6451_c0_g1_i1.p1 TRINITY_DN6451_c0_g1~~TRINITY_DN6451_c0_g1_i1.p1  ORF type:complete len:548 (-),score=95.48 TRINITY_DN6451_c0_g1_i1:9-1571(-)